MFVADRHERKTRVAVRSLSVCSYTALQQSILPYAIRSSAPSLMVMFSTFIFSFAKVKQVSYSKCAIVFKGLMKTETNHTFT